MLRVQSYRLKTATLPENVRINPDSIEDDVFTFIREASMQMPERPTARVAGGWVRDKLLGIPSKDIDITVDTMTGAEFAARLKQYAIRKWGPEQKVVGTVKDTKARPKVKNLAVAFLSIHDQEVEIVDMRAIEFYEEGNRNPTVIRLDGLRQAAKSPGGIPGLVKEKAPHLLPAIHKLPLNKQNDPLATLEMLDGHRRDLTINSLYYNINTGRPENPTGEGYDDLATMTLNAPIDPLQMFRDDPLRVLRVLRFYSRYPNSTIEPSVVQAMHDPGVQFQITRQIVNPEEEEGIVAERTTIELRKMMKGAQPEAALRIMFQTGLLAKILNLPPEFHPLTMDQQNKWHSLNVIEHTLQVIKHVNRLSAEFGLKSNERMAMNMAALFHDLGKLDPRSHKEKPGGARGYSGSQPANCPSCGASLDREMYKAKDKKEIMKGKCPECQFRFGIPHELSSQDQWIAFAKALKMTNEETDMISDLVGGHMRPHAHVEDEGPSIPDRNLRKYIRNNPDWVFQYIHAMADAMSKSEVGDQTLTDPYRTNLERIKQLAPTTDAFGNAPPVEELLKGNPLGERPGIIPIVMEELAARGLPPIDPKTGYIEDVKEAIRVLQDSNPNTTWQQAEMRVREMVRNGELDHYLRTV
jgi:tRNA nucleotidyltransferase/poly(A) polymerase